MKKFDKPKVVRIQVPTSYQSLSEQQSNFSDNNLDLGLNTKYKNKFKHFETSQSHLDTINPIEILGKLEKNGHYFGNELELLLKDP